MQNKYLYMLDLDKRSIMYLPGVGPKKAEILQKEAGISSYEDMLFYFPYKYIDRSRFYKVAEVTGDMPYIQMKGRILFFDTVGEGRTRRLIGKFTDGTGTIDLVWFKGINYVLDKIKTGVDYIVFGKPTEFGHIYNIPHPDIDPLDQADKVANGLTPFYNTSEKMKKSFLNSRAIQNLQYTLLSGLNWTLPETLPPDVLNRIRMMSFPEAIRNVHFPESVDKLRKAQLRLKFDELFFIQLNILRTSNLRKLKLRGIVFPSVGDYFNTFYKEYLPFELTNAQKRVVREIRADMGSGRQMNRLLQGDVGSGKTLVALLSMLLAVDNHCQACMMAPTEILATQHYATVMGFLKDMDIKVALLTGSTKKKERNKILPAIASGEIQLVIGTHALIEETVVFSSLGLAIIDEQHRFGVEQRSRLWTKNAVVPHVLVMTATPIPRTLAMTLYGDLDVSVIDELPPGRKPIQTVHRYDNKKAQLYDFLRKEIGQGRQVYVVYPLIEGSEKLADLWGVETTGICTGSGFVLTEDGYIVTNHHVIADADEGTVVVQFYSGEEYPAAIVGTDSMNDVALLKIEAKGLQTVTVGDSDEVEVGETVEAIGNPLGDLTFTMTAGYISALDREIDADGTPINMLQTDAAINSGNSGGPLFDMNGNIIGVTTAKVSGTTETGVTIEGLGFAIPINDVLRVVYDLQQYGRVRGRAYLGVTLQNLDAEVAEIYGLPSGPQVVTVTEGSCSEKAGLQPHDIILEFDGREINAYSDLVSALSKHRAGDTVKLKLYRAGAEIEVTLTLDERPGEEEINEAEQQAQNELEGQSGQEEEFTVPDFDGYGYDYGG